MNVFFPISIITLKEGIRNRAIYGISLFALMLLGLSLFVASMSTRDVGKVAVDMALSIISFSGLLVVLFVGINLMAKDLDKKTIYMVLSKPISRSEYILGKFLGIIMILFLTTSFITFLASGFLFFLNMNYAAYFPRFSWLLFFLSVFFIMISLVLLTAISFLFSSVSSSSFTTLFLTIISYLIGQSLGDIKALIDAGNIAGEPVPQVTRIVVQAVYYLFPNLSFFDIKTQVAHGLAVQLSCGRSCMEWYIQPLS
jgi:Cu-processing system permease protein